MRDRETTEIAGRSRTPQKASKALGFRFDLDVVPASSGGETVLYPVCLDVRPENTVSGAGFSKDGSLPSNACGRLREALVASNCTLADLGEVEMMLLVENLKGRWLAGKAAPQLADPLLKRSAQIQTTPERSY